MPASERRSCGVTHLSLPKWTDDTVGGEDGRSVALGVDVSALATTGNLAAVARIVPAARATPTTAKTVRHDRPRVSRPPSPDPAPTQVPLTVWSISSIDTGGLSTSHVVQTALFRQTVARWCHCSPVGGRALVAAQRS